MQFPLSPQFRDPSLAPEVENDLVRRLVHGELDERDKRLVYLLIVSFESWNKAHQEALIEELHRRH